MTDAELIAALHRLCETLKATAPHDRFLGVPIYDLTNEAATRLSVMREALERIADNTGDTATWDIARAALGEQ